MTHLPIIKLFYRFYQYLPLIDKNLFNKQTNARDQQRASDFLMERPEVIACINAMKCT